MPLSTNTTFFSLLADSYRRRVGKSLVPYRMRASRCADWLYEAAPFAVLAHDTSPDPVFMYGNRRAQAIFGYDWDELTELPSRLSAEPAGRAERQVLLEKVRREGFISGYRGVRVTKTGERFLVHNATIWELVDLAGNYRGQAVLIPRVLPIRKGSMFEEGFCSKAAGAAQRRVDDIGCRNDTG